MLRVLAMDATTQEMAVMDASVTNRAADSEIGKQDGPVCLEAVAALGHWHEQGALKDEPSVHQPESSQGGTGPRSKSSADGKANPNAEKSPEEVAVEQNRVS
jgi:hypothetical protein